MPPKGWRKNKSVVEVPLRCPNCGDPDSAHREGSCMACPCSGWVRLGPRNDQGVPAGWYDWNQLHP